MITVPTKQAIVQALGGLDKWSKRCHEASLHLVRSGVFDEAHKPRVARGACRGVTSQHSWVVLGGDCYADDAPIVDPTLWSYDPSVKGVYIGIQTDISRHTPNGYGSIWEWGKPVLAGGEIIPLKNVKKLSKSAQYFLADIIGPLDYRGWARLASAPVGGWNAGEILAAMSKTPGLEAVVPIDKLGMVTDLNPQNLYW